MVRVVAAVCGEIEGNGQALLARGKVLEKIIIL